MVEFVDKGEARVDKERSRWREALDRDVQLRIPHAKFRLLLKAEKAKKKLEKKRQEDKAEAEANGKQPDTNPTTTMRGTTELGERTHTDWGDQHPGWIRPGLATRVLRVRYAHQLWEHHAHLWDRANSFWDEVKTGIAQAKAVQRSNWLHPTLQEACWRWVGTETVVLAPAIEDTSALPARHIRKGTEMQQEPARTRWMALQVHNHKHLQEVWKVLGLHQGSGMMIISQELAKHPTVKHRIRDGWQLSEKFHLRYTP